MRRACTIALLLAAVGCSARKPTVAPDPRARAAASLAAADALVLAGCFDCLAEAFRTYDALHTEPTVAAAATAGAARTAALLAIRERELGTEDSGYLARARAIATSAPTLQAAVDPLIEIADTLPVRGGSRQVSDDVELARMQAAYRNKAIWTDYLRDHANDDPLASYLWLAFNCAYTPAGSLTPDAWLAHLTSVRESPLAAFKAGTCGRYSADRLQPLLDSDTRFVELNYFLGLAAMFSGRIDPAIQRMQRAYDWRPRWPAVTSALASAYVTLEDFDRAIEFYDRTLAVVPRDPDALLGKVKALTYAGRHAEAIAVTDQLVALEHWYIGDARYWRALNEAQLERYDAAWEDVELAAKLLVNASVPKLAGIIAYRRKQPDVARAKFEESRERNPDDCETGFYLGVVLAEQAVWPRTADVLAMTARCLESAEHTLTEEIARIGASEDPPDRKARQIARREQQIAAGRRMLATSSFDIAVACFNLGRTSEARAYAEKVEDDEQFGARARELLGRLR